MSSFFQTYLNKPDQCALYVYSSLVIAFYLKSSLNCFLLRPSLSRYLCSCLLSFVLCLEAYSYQQAIYICIHTSLAAGIPFNNVHRIKVGVGESILRVSLCKQHHFQPARDRIETTHRWQERKENKPDIRWMIGCKCNIKG